MNKKAFTLVELLAVIIVLGILSAIAAGAYYKYLDYSKKESFEMAEKTFVNNLKNAYTDCLANSSNEFCDMHNNFGYVNEVIFLQELIYTGYSKRIKNPYDTDTYCDANRSYVRVIVNNNETLNNKDITYQVCLVCGDRLSTTCN